MKRRLYFFLLVCALSFGLALSSPAQQSGYTPPEKAAEKLSALAAGHPDACKLHDLTSTAGGHRVVMLEIGKDIKSKIKTNPAVLVIADLSGIRPLGVEGALQMADKLLADPESYAERSWYIIPCANPDAASRYFEKPLYESSRNMQPYNDDQDDQTDEDGPEDLNNDGVITMMRVKDPDGTWIIDEKEPRLLRRANPSKGETGVYKLYTEGLDNDGDGAYNEDGEGGSNPGINFPPLFKYFSPEAGLYPGSAPESYAIMAFVFEHPEIAMLISLDGNNLSYTPFRTDRKSTAAGDKFKIPERRAAMLGADPEKEYTMKEVTALVQARFPDREVDESMVSSFLGLGAVVNPLEADMAFYKKYSQEYRAYLKKEGLTGKRFDAAQPADGSLELWAYLHVGVPVFSSDLWALPMEEAEKGDSLPAKKEVAKNEKELALLVYSDKVLNGQGFIPWKPYRHPTLGDVEIGGFVPFTSTTPPRNQADSSLSAETGWIMKLAGDLPKLEIYETKITARGSGIYELDIWVSNSGDLPFPTAMGKRNKQPAPAVILLEGSGIDFLEGYARTAIDEVGANGRKKLSWLIRSDKTVTVKISLESKAAGNDQKTVKIGGKS